MLDMCGCQKPLVGRFRFGPECKSSVSLRYRFFWQQRKTLSRTHFFLLLPNVCTPPILSNLVVFLCKRTHCCYHGWHIWQCPPLLILVSNSNSGAETDTQSRRSDGYRAGFVLSNRNGFRYTAQVYSSDPRRKIRRHQLFNLFEKLPCRSVRIAASRYIDSCICMLRTYLGLFRTT